MNDGKENKYELNEKMSVKYIRRKCKNNKYMVILKLICMVFVLKKIYY